MCFGNVILLFIIFLPIDLTLSLITEEFSININDLTDGDSDILNQAYVQTGSELYYFKDVSYQDSILLPSDHNRDISSDPRQKSQKNVNLFEQEVTDFGSTEFGIPIQRKIYIYNPTNFDISFEAVVSLGANFHCSFLEKELLFSKQHTSFRVFFLPTTDEPAVKEEIIMVQTSIGKFIHKLRGEVAGNPYRIKSLMGIHVPLNATISVPVQLHNPHTAYMRVLEIFSSDCHLHMVENSGKIDQKNNANSLLEPYETKEIAFAKILGDIERNTTTFIFIKFRLEKRKHRHKNNILTLHEEQEIFTIILPMEIEITRRRGLFATVHLLDFGLIKAGDQINPLTLSIFSTLERGIEIESVNVDTSHGIYLQFENRPPISVKPEVRAQPGAPVEIASINVDTNNFEMNEMEENANPNLARRHGLVMAESRGGNYNVSVPFKAVIYKGGLTHDPEDVSLHKDLKPVIIREVVLTNTLPYGLAISSAELAKNAKNAFKVSLNSKIVMLSPGQSLPIFTFHYLESVAANFSSHIILHTNITSFLIPFYLFHGELTINIHSLEQDRFQFGMIRYGETRSISFTLSNSNPIPLILEKFYMPSQLSIKFISMHEIESSHKHIPLNDNDKCKGKATFCLPAQSSALFKMILSAGTYNQNFTFSESVDRVFRIKTQFSAYDFPVHYTFSNSTTLLSVPKKIILKQTFIGSVTTQPLMLLNKFPDALRVLRISISTDDPRFLLAVANNQTIQPSVPTNIANLTFVPEAICPRDCYLGMPLNASDGQWFAYGMKLPQNLAEIDSYLYGRLKRKWIQLKDKVVRTTISLDADKVRGLEIPVEANLVWPRLFSHSVVHFPLTAVGNFSIVNLTITNPSTLPVIVQLLPIVIYPAAPEALLELFQDELPAPLIDPIEVNETLMFSLRDTELFTLKPESPVPKLRDEVEKIVEGPLPRFTLSLLLRPGISTRIRIGFLPSDYSLRSSLLIIRNNLTALEPVILYGRGARINMEIDNKTARSQPLLFELEAMHLTDCTNPRRQLHRMPTTLTVRRTFPVRNSGEVGFSVTNISVNGVPCENRGYRVLNCFPFRLEPNETTFLDIAFTPDFLFSINEATLQLYIHMNGTPWAFNMASMIPRHLLSVCHSALPRPPFEAVMYQTCVLALIFCLICVISCAYLEGDRVIMYAYKQQFLSEQECEVFDLNAPEESIQDPIEVGWIIDNIQKRKFLQISAEDGTLKRLFWQTMNFVLWIFSHIWPLIRSSQTHSSRSQHKRHRKLIQNFDSMKERGDITNQADAGGIIDAVNPPKMDGFNVSSKLPNYRAKKKIIYDLEQTILNDDSISSSTVSEDVNGHISEQTFMISGKKQKQKIKREERNNFYNGDHIFVQKISSNMSQIPESNKMHIKLDASNMQSGFKNGFNRKSESEQLPNRIKVPTDDSSPTRFSEVSNRIVDIKCAQFIDDTLISDDYNHDQKMQFVSKISIHSTEPSHSNSCLKNSFDAEGSYARSLSRSSRTDDKTSWHNSNSLDGMEEERSLDGYDEKKDLSEESDIPEWADEILSKGDADGDFDILAKQSAALFESIEETCMPSASSSFNSTFETDKVKMEAATRNEDAETERIIAQFTQEYRERLTKILKNKKCIGDILIMPPDLTPNIDGCITKNPPKSCTFRKNPIRGITGKKETIARRKSPGGELRNMSIARRERTAQKQNQTEFLFNINDPIWKPIGAFGEMPVSDWPDFQMKRKNDPGK